MTNIKQIVPTAITNDIFKELTKKAMWTTIGNEVNPLNQWIQQVEDYSQTNKQKGDLFEILCKCYFEHRKMKTWLLHELPDDIRSKLGLCKKDMGIDLVALDRKGNWHAIQAKFKGRRNAYKRYGKHTHVPQVTWKEISTFDTLCRRTGPYVSHWVVTTGDRVRRIGRKQKTDRSICYKSLCNLEKTDFWRDLCDMKGYKLGNDDLRPFTGDGDVKSKVDYIRKQRAKWINRDKNTGTS